MQYAHTTYPVSDGRIRLAKVDCTVETVRPPPPPSRRAPEDPPRRAAPRRIRC